MIVRKLNELEGTKFDVTTPDQWNSIRMLVASDGMGFSFHITTIFAGVSYPIHYENHLEAVYCLSGSGQVTYDDGSAEVELEPGTLYAPNRHDEHVLTAHTELKLVCVFNPPTNGKETLNETGGYDLPENE